MWSHANGSGHSFGSFRIADTIPDGERSGGLRLEPLRLDLYHGKRNMVLGRPALDALPFDVLCLMRDCIAETDLCQHIISASRLEESSVVDWRAHSRQHHPLDALSRVSRSIRAVCCPVMFSRIKLSEAILPPCAILSYTCMLWITLRDLDNLRFDYHGMLRSMTRLRTIFWQPSEASELPECNVKFALSSPTLTTFMTRNFQFRGVMSPLTATSLQALDVSQGWRDLTRVTVGEIDAEKQFLESLIAQLVPQLQVLRIPGESCRLSFLAATAWPHLRELVIRGGAPKTDVSFCRLFSVMPRLRILALAIVPSLVLHPADSAWGHDVRPSLRRLTITNVLPNEGIFSHLSGELTELSLRDQPRYYRRRLVDGNEVSKPLLACQAALYIIHTLALCGASLRRLEIVVREDGAEMQLLSLIAKSCPNLTFFELHQYRADDTAFMRLPCNEVDTNVDAIVNVLSPLCQLRVLRLNLDLGLYSHGRPGLAFQAWDPVLTAQAGVVAHILHWLDIISFLTTHMVGVAVWRTWYPHRSPSGEVNLEYDYWTGNSAVDQEWF